MFSVVIPLYNKEKYILRAVESVLSQSFVNFELIIVDDGSIDNSLTAIESITDSRVRIVKQTNQGVGSARNKGIAEAKYDWVALLDADDIWASNHLHELIKIIQISSSLGMVATKFLDLHTDTSTPSIDENKPSNIRIVDYFLEASKETMIVHSSTVAISKKVFYNIGGFSNSKIGEDLEYWAKVALHYPVATSDRVTAFYCKGTNGAMETFLNSKQKYQKITSLREMSPALDMLIDEASKNPSILKEKNKRKYVNSRILIEVKEAIFREDFSIGKSYAKLALPQPDTKYLFLTMYRIIPNSVLRRIKDRYEKARINKVKIN